MSVITPIDEETEFKNKLTGFFTNMKDFLSEKNKRYGNSALDPIQVFAGKKDSTLIDVRIDDKLSRIKNSEELRKNDTIDLIGYLVLKCFEKKWDDFRELID